MDRLMPGVSPDLLAFLRTQIDSFVKWDLIHFFHENPHTMDTVENIARCIGRRTESVQVELAEMVTHGVLAERKLDSLTIYSLSRDPATRALLHRFVENCDDQRFRIGAIYQIVRTMR